MKGIEDPIAKKSIKKLLDLNWRHYNLYIVGGLIQGWETKDIDIVITGPIINHNEFVYLISEASKIDFIDVSYQKNHPKNLIGESEHIDPITIDVGRLSKPSKKINSYFENGLWFRIFSYPTLKQIKNKRVYISHPVLIH
jgi:hypothetical protein|tara:strand:- start:46 stop:465 length:420 start_codon:yes stop_codon:yes gene_type:complete